MRAMLAKHIVPRDKEPGESSDAVEVATAAGLRYVSDAIPGLRRKRTGRGFSYIGLDGRPVHDPVVLARIKALAIPPAWTEVWIAPTPRGHIQATGRDAKGRKQYRYHTRWRELRDETKFGRMVAFGTTLPVIRARVGEDLARPGLPRERVLAAVVALLDTSHIRVGNEEYARTNGSFGLTTLRNKHVAISGATLRFRFRGKAGKQHTIGVRDRRLARIVKRCQELPGHELFQYLDDEGQLHSVDSDDVNEYLRQAAGEDFTAKDFRTWAGTVFALRALRTLGAFDSKAQANKNVAQAITETAAELGNTQAVCRKCYVHPAVVDAYLDGSLLQQTAPDNQAKAPEGLRPEEAMVLALLRRSAEPSGRDRGAA